jgi:hypothetical protein
VGDRPHGLGRSGFKSEVVEVVGGGVLPRTGKALEVTLFLLLREHLGYYVP